MRTALAALTASLTLAAPAPALAARHHHHRSAMDRCLQSEQRQWIHYYAQSLHRWIGICEPVGPWKHTPPGVEVEVSIP